MVMIFIKGSKMMIKEVEHLMGWVKYININHVKV